MGKTHLLRMCLYFNKRLCYTLVGIVFFCVKNYKAKCATVFVRNGSTCPWKHLCSSQIGKRILKGRDQNKSVSVP